MRKQIRNTRGNNYGFRQIILNYIKQNKREYTLVVMLFIIGIIIGVIWINKSNQWQTEEISIYINGFVKNMKEHTQINQLELLKQGIITNLLFVVTIWFVGSTVIGLPIVCGMVIYRGFCLGYTIASAMLILGTKGILFSLSTLLIQNILFIPSLLALAVSGIRLYQSIVKDKRKENIKLEITRHTIFCLFISLVIAVSVVLEVYVSTGLMQIISKYL